MAEERKIPTAVGVVCGLGLGLATIDFGGKVEGRPYLDSLTAFANTPGRELITRVGQLVEVELDGPYGSISRIISVREPEEDVAERVMPASNDRPGP